ncbi:MAG: mandelate racemase/muconate lactonizing enzyme family protein [Synergistaceae bacterium]|nr:mandelate racemase/muconate lactonizing enzyme family protein [Synergistaceae bacterium]
MIDNIIAVPINVNEKVERELAYGKISVRKNVLVLIRDSSGGIGIGETEPITMREGCEENQSIIVGLVNNEIKQFALGMEPDQISQLEREIEHRIGMVPYTKTAVIDATYDLLGKCLGTPVSTLLGGALQDKLALSWSIGFKKTPQDVSNEASWAKSAGFKWIKVKIGSRDPLRDISSVAAARDALGPDFPIHADANGKYDYDTALRTLKKMERYDVQLFEQPVAGWDLQGMSKLRSKLSTPIMADESVTTPRTILRVIEAQAADAVLMKLAKHGGIKASKAIADIAYGAGIKVYPGTHLSTSVGIATSAQFYSTVENPTPGDFHGGSTRMAFDIVEHSLLPDDGYILVPQLPGCGMKLDLHGLRRAVPDEYHKLLAEMLPEIADAD